MATKRLDADLQGTPTDQTTYRRMIGGLMYLTASRLDIAYVTFVCDRYQARPTVKHLKEFKRIFWYLRHSYNMGLWYPKDSGFELITYSDADHAGCKDDCKSTSGGLQSLGEKLVSWSPKKQDCTAMSTAEAEYVSFAIAISCNPVQHSMTKHIDIRYHFIKEHVEKGTVELYFVGTEYQLADLFTKALPKERFEYLVHRIEVDLEHVQCLPESKILTNIIKNHPFDSVLLLLPLYHGSIWHSSGRYKAKLECKNYRLGDDFKRLKHTEYYRMYAEVFGLDVPLTKSSAPKRSTVIRFRLPERRSTRLTPPALVPTVDKADEMILQHLASVEIEKMVEGSENVIDDSLLHRNDEPNSGTRSPNDKEGGISNVVIPVYVNEEEEEYLRKCMT
ncbi:hypothetical protein Tco_0779221 [Tanacetum coccineum]